MLGHFFSLLLYFVVSNPLPKEKKRPQYSPLPYQIYCKAALWESTHALPSLSTAPWQLLLYIPLQMRPMNQRDYRVEQKQWGRGGKRVRRVGRKREREGEGKREEGRQAVKGKGSMLQYEVSWKVYFVHLLWITAYKTRLPRFYETIGMRIIQGMSSNGQDEDLCLHSSP